MTLVLAASNTGDGSGDERLGGTEGKHAIQFVVGGNRCV